MFFEAKTKLAKLFRICQENGLQGAAEAVIKAEELPLEASNEAPKDQNTERSAPLKESEEFQEIKSRFSDSVFSSSSVISK